jgi:hypothetical protein
MGSTFNLVKLAVGDPDLLPTVARPRLVPSLHFDLFDVQLPLPKFSGIPQAWIFAVLSKERTGTTELKQEAVLADARSVIASLPQTKLVLFVSDNPKVHLADEFGTLERELFCLDWNELPHTKDPRAQPRLAPLILAMRRRLSIDPILASAFSPYQRNTPVSGWRFFGREKQLREITNTSENLVVVGARRVGKTSLLLEAERRLREDGKKVYYVDVQNCRTANEVVSEILRIVSPREAARAIKHHEVFQEPVFSTLLRQMSAGPEKTLLLLDELGNVLSSLPKEDWTFMGLLRKYGAKEGLKFVISCFQELYFKQQTEFAGPLINLANTLRLNVFNRKEVEEFAIAPLDFWKPLGADRHKLLDLVISNVGSHPYFLQFFCHAFFDRFAGGSGSDPLRQAHLLLERDLHEWFSNAVDEIFFRIPSPTVRYLFLRRCHESETAGQPLNQGEFSDDWVEKTLLDLGYHSNTRGRRNLLDSLEMHGLCSAIDYDRAKKVIAGPLVYHYVRKSNNSFDAWLAKLAQEIEKECTVWELN